MSSAHHIIDPNEVKSRDYLMVAIINGATKTGTHKDKKKDENKKACRKWKHSNQED